MTDRNEQRVVYESNWDAETEPSSTHAVVSAVASVEGNDATELRRYTRRSTRTR